MSQVLDDSLEAGREAARKHAWRDAYELLQKADADRLLGAEDLERLAEAAWWTGHLEQAIDLRERAYAAYTEAGEPRRAALLALALSGDHANKAAFSVASGWLSRADRLLADEPEGVEHGHLALTHGIAASYMGQLDQALGHLGRAQELGARFGERNLEAMAQVFRGTTLVMAGQVSEGLALLDEATAAAVSGELEPLTTGMVYCVTIHSCQTLGDCGRAAEWTTAANRWCDRLDVSGFPGACRVHRAEIMRLQGDWDRAEEQAVQACDELHGYQQLVTASGFYEIGEIRRRRGDFAAAEEAYRKSSELGHSAQPGLALLRLAEGKVEAAASAMKRELANEELDPLSRARRLPAQVEIALATGELGRARSAAAELEAIADQYRVDDQRTPSMEGALQLALAQIRLAERDFEGAAAAARAARKTWDKIGAPYEAAQARMLLGLAYRGEGDEDGGREEIAAAKATFERLGAALDTQRAAELLGEGGTARTFVFTDIVDSTKLLEALGEEKWQKLLKWHDRLLRERIEEAGGEVIKQTGDGYFAAFGSPAAALDAAIAIQRALDEEPIAPDVRIGVHSGKAFHTEDDDYTGQGVHMAARIGALAGGGEILVSTASLDGARRFRFSEPRSESLKGFSEPVELVAVQWR
ncbi:MAG TPA: adenylate/guanylate cyclase domain-containing protein [Gaiellaceae bacterium]|nr:adenylate/guanylate cyclase domain-containing protein [Gaiellaceae bacterium]